MTALGRPSLRPCALARCRPAITRSRMRPRSNSAKAARIWSCSFPAGVVQSIPSPSETNTTPRCCKSSSFVTRWRSEPIQPPADQHIEATALGVTDQIVEGGATILRPAHAAIDVLNRRPATRVDIPSKLLELVLRFLVQRAHAGVDGGLQAATCPSAGAATAPAFRI